MMMLPTVKQAADDLSAILDEACWPGALSRRHTTRLIIAADALLGALYRAGLRDHAAVITRVDL